MSKKKKPKKVRVAFRKNRGRRVRSNKLSHDLDDDIANDRLLSGERVSGKGEITRHRTLIVEPGGGDQPLRNVDGEKCLNGRVIAAVGLNSLVSAEDGKRYECTVRRVVRTLARDARNAVVTGDHVLFLPIDGERGVIERVEPRHGIVSRGSHRYEHILVANVDRVIIVTSAADPALKPSLIDRFLISAEKGETQPVICINKIDLADPAELQPIIGLYSQLGYEVVTTQAVSDSPDKETHPGVVRLRAILKGRQAVFAGQSGVGKSSLLNAIQPGWNLLTGEVSDWTRKGKHTTRRAVLLQLDFGGWVIDTPGFRQFELWDVIPEEVEGFFVEFRPFVTLCRFPDCSHTHEQGCGVKTAVEQKRISSRRYESYLKIFHGDDGKRPKVVSPD